MQGLHEINFVRSKVQLVKLYRILGPRGNHKFAATQSQHGCVLNGRLSICPKKFPQAITARTADCYQSYHLGQARLAHGTSRIYLSQTIGSRTFRVLHGVSRRSQSDFHRNLWRNNREKSCLKPPNPIPLHDRLPSWPVPESKLSEKVLTVESWLLLVPWQQEDRYSLVVVNHKRLTPSHGAVVHAVGLRGRDYYWEQLAH